MRAGAGITIVAVALALCFGGGSAQASQLEQAQKATKTLKKYCRVYGPFGSKAKMMRPAPGFTCRKHGPFKYGKGGIGFGRSYVCEPIAERGFKFGINAVCEL